MSLQTLNYLRNSDSQSKPKRLSEAIDQKNMINGDMLTVNFLGITEIDKIPGFYLKVTKLNLSHNRISSLSLISQFQHLTHINLSHNLLGSFEELLKISNREKVVVLTLDGNPCVRHPDIIPLVLVLCPRLVEINGVKVTDHTRQDINDGVSLANKMIAYCCKNDKILEDLDKDVKNIKLEFELLQHFKGKISSETGPYWEDINARHLKDLKKTPNLPKLPSFAYHTKVRPYMILDYIDLVGKSLHYHLPDQIDEIRLRRVYKWVFCEILIHLHSWGLHTLQLFLQENTTKGSLDQCFDEEINFFRRLGITQEDYKGINDIFPSYETEVPIRIKSFQRILEKNSDNWSYFPVFSCDSDYLKALLSVLQAQVSQIEELQREKEELLSFDASCLGLPSFSDQYMDSIRVFPYELSQDLRASSRTTMNRHGSPNQFNYSPNGLNDIDKKNLNKVYDEDLDQEFLKKNLEEEKKMLELKLRAEYDLEKQILDQKNKEFEENKIKELIEIENRKTEKLYMKIQEKNNKLIVSGFNHLSDFFINAMRGVFNNLKLWSATIKENDKETTFKISKALEKYNKKLLYTSFLGLRYNQIISKTKKIKAEDYYKGRLILDSFYLWKNFYVSRKTKKIENIDKSKSLKKIKNHEDVKLRKEFEELLKRLVHSEKNIKRLWKIIKNKKNSVKRECLCGGFKCPSCIKEKTSFIQTELMYLKKKIAESKSKKPSKRQ